MAFFSLIAELLGVLLTIVLGLGFFAAILLAFYWVFMHLPGRWRERGHLAVFVGPAVIFLIVGLAMPAARTLWLSFHNDKPLDREFIGLDNYQSIFTQKNTQQTLVNNLTWVIVGTLATTLFALVVARFSDGMKGERTAKSLIFFPTAISLVGAGITWKFIYAYQQTYKLGLLNQVTKTIPGLPANMGGDGEKNWILDRDFAGVDPPVPVPGFNTFLLIIIFVWVSAGISTVILSAAIKGVPASLTEAARVDGATQRQVFYKVTVPYIRSTIVTVMTLTAIAALKAFDIVAAVTGGNYGTGLLANDYMNIHFLQNRDAMAAAVACVIFVLVIPVVIINRRSQRHAEEMLGR